MRLWRWCTYSMKINGVSDYTREDSTISSNTYYIRDDGLSPLPPRRRRKREFRFLQWRGERRVTMSKYSTCSPWIDTVQPHRPIDSTHSSIVVVMCVCMCVFKKEKKQSLSVHCGTAGRKRTIVRPCKRIVAPVRIPRTTAIIK